MSSSRSRSAFQLLTANQLSDSSARRERQIDVGKCHYDLLDSVTKLDALYAKIKTKLRLGIHPITITSLNKTHKLIPEGKGP